MEDNNTKKFSEEIINVNKEAQQERLKMYKEVLDRHVKKQPEKTEK